jgi:glutathione S-transferase
MSGKIRLYSHPISGHGHRVELFCNLAGIEHEVIQVNLLAGEQKTPPFLKLNPFGKVPVIEDGEDVLADSLAILIYLAKKYAPSWIPVDPIEEARMHAFFAIAAGELVRGPTTARAINLIKRPLDLKLAQSEAVSILEKLEFHLLERDWFVSSQPTLADVALYTYIHLAPEGGISLSPYPRLLAWLQRVEGLEGFVAMQANAVGLNARA